MYPQDLIKIGYFTSAGTPADYEVDIGWIPDFVLLFPEITAAADIGLIMWTRPMGADKAFRDKVVADNGATGNLSQAFVSSNGITALDRTAIIPVGWKASTVYAVGDIVHPTVLNGKMYRCTTAGTSHSAEPTWLTVVGGTTSEGGGTVVWTCLSEGDEDYSAVRKTKVQGFTVAAELQKASTKNHYVAMRAAHVTE